MKWKKSCCIQDEAADSQKKSPHLSDLNLAGLGPVPNYTRTQQRDKKYRRGKGWSRERLDKYERRKGGRNEEERKSNEKTFKEEARKHQRKK